MSFDIFEAEEPDFEAEEPDFGDNDALTISEEDSVELNFDNFDLDN